MSSSVVQWVFHLRWQLDVRTLFLACCVCVFPFQQEQIFYPVMPHLFARVGRGATRYRAVELLVVGRSRSHAPVSSGPRARLCRLDL